MKYRLSLVSRMPADAAVLLGRRSKSSSADEMDSLFRTAGYEKRELRNATVFRVSGEAKQASCLVLDIRLPVSGEADLQAEFTEAGGTMPVIVMTSHGCIPMSLRAAQSAPGNLECEPVREQAMHDALERAFANDADERAERGHADGLRTRYDMLSPREKVVMGRVATGKMNKQIAFELGLSEITIKIHRGNAMRKMGAKTLVDFSRMAELLKLAT
jgi:FixJ family two-component response regulator